MWQAYRKNTSPGSFRESIWYKDNHEGLGLQDVKVKVVGVWDTVGALGMPRWWWVRLLQKAGFDLNKQYSFHNTKVSKRKFVRMSRPYLLALTHVATDSEYAFQALVLDEHRSTFTPTLWHKTSNGPSENLVQCWIPGSHGDVGGFGELGDVTLAWTLDNLNGMLTFEEGAIQALLGRQQSVRVGSSSPDSWGCGPIEDSSSGLSGKLLGLLGRENRTPGDYPNDPGDNASGETSEFVHPVARFRKDHGPDYPSPPLGYYTVNRKMSGQGWQWERARLDPLPELVMKKCVVRIAYQDDGEMMFKDDRSLSRQMCPGGVLSELDVHNGIPNSA